MSDTETQEAYGLVTVTLPNGAVVRGKSIPWSDAVEIITLNDRFISGESPTQTLLPMLKRFTDTSGITFADLRQQDPHLTLGELIDVFNAFFYHRRPARTNGASPPASPGV